MIPGGALLQLDENSALGGMVSVIWNEETYEVFRDDVVRLGRAAGSARNAQLGA
ncbi:MAG TPA: hypothetical protein VFA04_06855 [Bryobacteraceae bacterium]|nr:hypothetical protein [Bryobacteraceae bacterium]